MVRLLLPSCYLISFDKEGGIAWKTTGSHAWYLSSDILISRITGGRRSSWTIPSTCTRIVQLVYNGRPDGWSSMYSILLLLQPAFIHLARISYEESRASFIITMNLTCAFNPTFPLETAVTFIRDLAQSITNRPI